MTTVRQKEVEYFQHQIRFYWKCLLKKTEISRSTGRKKKIPGVYESAMSVHREGLCETKQKGLCSWLIKKLTIKHWVFGRVSTEGIANI